MAPAEIHSACGHAHRLNDECVVPPDSPRGLLARSLFSTSTDTARALDRLAAIAGLRALLDNQEPEAVLGARMAGCTLTQIDPAGAHPHWAEMVRRFENAGLLRPVEDTGS